MARSSSSILVALCCAAALLILWHLEAPPGFVAPPRAAAPAPSSAAMQAMLGMTTLSTMLGGAPAAYAEEAAETPKEQPGGLLTIFTNGDGDNAIFNILIVSAAVIILIPNSRFRDWLRDMKMKS